MGWRIGMSIAFCLLVCAVLPLNTSAQGNYEIQVYPYETVAPRHTMVELHSNFTFQGSKSTDDGTLPTNHQLHETIEITQGFNDWFETGVYIFTSAENGQGWDYVGSHIRPPRARSSQMALAGRSQSVKRNRLAEPPIFRGHLDVGNSPYRG